MTKDLGKKEGKILVFGGSYSNLHALQALKAEAEQMAIPSDNIFCTGDIVAYCAFPEESIQFVKDWGIHVIAGNVEYSLRDDEDDCGCNFGEGSNCEISSKSWFSYAKSQVSQDSIQYLKTLPQFIQFQYDGKKHFVLHGSYFNTSQFIFKSTEWSNKADNFLATRAHVILAGHCGIPFSDVYNGCTWINAGVIGMPANDGNTSTWYTILDRDQHSFRQLIYDHNAASFEMNNRSLPGAYAETLITGIWDNCDMLPAIETKLQGRQLNINSFI